MKLTFLLAISLLVSFGITAQTIFTDNFDSYTSGNKVAQSCTSGIWTTWSNAPGGSEDADVSSTQSSSASNSAYIQNDNDLVLLFNDKTSGRYKIDFNVFIESGAMGYFNILQDFAGSNSEWGMQITFNGTGVTKVDAGGDSITGFNFNFDQWYAVTFIVDIDDDFATMFFDGNEVVSWKWSGGSFGSGTVNKLDAADFYGLSQNGYNSGMYLDDINFEQVVAPDAPINLQATLNGSDIDLDWTAPSSTPDSYTISGNSDIITQGLTGLTYTYTNPYPATYTFNSRAFYNGLGYSHSSNDAIATRPGGVNRDYVVFEVGTGTWCYYCPGAALACEDLETNGDSAASIEYHTGDSYATTESEARVNHYNMTGIPTSVADGALTIEGGNHTSSLYTSYKTNYDKRKARPALFTIGLVADQVAAYDYTVDVSMTQNSDYFAGAKKLYAVITESNIAEAWQGQTELDFVSRDVIPDENGTSFDFSTQTTQSTTINFSLDPSWVKNNCKLVVFLQDSTTDEIVQAEMIDLSTVVTVKENKQLNVSVYPNPANNILYVNSDNEGTYQIFNILGDNISNGKLSDNLNTIDVSNLKSGVYFINVSNGQAVTKVKFIKE